MVVRRRFGSSLPIVLAYACCFAAAGFFVYHAKHGPRGIETRKVLKLEYRKLEADLADLERERRVWDQRVALMRTDQAERDMLEERARRMLDRVHQDEIVVFTGTARPTR